MLKEILTILKQLCANSQEGEDEEPLLSQPRKATPRLDTAFQRKQAEIARLRAQAPMVQPKAGTMRRCSDCNSWSPSAEGDCPCTYCGNCRNYKVPGHPCVNTGAWYQVKPPIEVTQPTATPLPEYISADDHFRYEHSLAARRAGKFRMENMHVSLRLEGELENIEMFHILMHVADSDYPVEPKCSRLAADELIDVCKRCHGFVWPRATIGTDEIKRAAKQCDIMVLIVNHRKAQRCRGEIEHLSIADAFKYPAGLVKVVAK